MNLQEYLKPFIDKLPKNEKGAEEYLRGKTREEVIEASLGNSFSAPLDSSITESRREIVTRTVDRNIEEYNKRIGEKLVFVLLQTYEPPTMKMEVHKVWESDLTEDKWAVAEIRDDEHDSLPRLVRKS